MTTLTLSAAVISGMLLVPMSTMAQSSPRSIWVLTGHVDAKPFLVECDFRIQGATLGGRCTDINDGDRSRPGKVHQISQGSVSGNRLRWTYPVRVMFMSVDINFSGTTTGDRMSGAIDVKGHHGQFSATRKPMQPG